MPTLARSIGLSVFAAICQPAVFSQASTPFISAKAAVTVNAGARAEPMDLADKVLGMVGPSEHTRLTGKDRFQIYLLSVGGPVPLLGEAVGAGIGQGINSPAEWGQGWRAFGERYGSNLAYNGVRQTISYGAAMALHEDTRYFASGRHGFWGRTHYALLSTFTARRPDGRQSFSVPA